MSKFTIFNFTKFSEWVSIDFICVSSLNSITQSLPLMNRVDESQSSFEIVVKSIINYFFQIVWIISLLRFLFVIFNFLIQFLDLFLKVLNRLFKTLIWYKTFLFLIRSFGSLLADDTLRELYLLLKKHSFGLLFQLFDLIFFFL